MKSKSEKKWAETALMWAVALATGGLGAWYINDVVEISPCCVALSPPNPWFIGLFGVLVIAGLWFFMPDEVEE